MTCQEVMAQLEALGSEQTRKTWDRHGAPANRFGVKVGDMKPIVKKIKKDYQLAKDLYATGNSDAQYFAGLIADDEKMTKKDLQTWADSASWHMVGEWTVPWVAAGSHHGWEMALKWIESKQAPIVSTGWATLASLAGYKDDDELDIPAYNKLLDRVRKTIHSAPNRVRYVMNSFVIAVGGGIIPLHEKAVAVANSIGVVDVDVGDTACKVPLATEYIEKLKARGLGKKRKSLKC